MEGDSAGQLQLQASAGEQRWEIYVVQIINVELYQSYFKDMKGHFERGKYLNIYIFCNSGVYPIPEVLFNEARSINSFTEAKQMRMEPPTLLNFDI